MTAKEVTLRTKLKEEEKLIIEVKKHWIVLSKPIIAIAGILFILLNLNKYNLFGFKDTLFKAGLYGMAACILYFVYVYLDRKYDIWAVTNQRVIDESGIITHKAKESPLEKINNIDIVQTLAGRLMGYGRVQIQTAATEGESWIDFVEKPVALQDAIIRERENLKKNLKEKETLEEKTTSAKDTVKKEPQREPQRETQETRECPFCAETILKKAKICRFCGRDLPEEKSLGENPTKETLAKEILTEKVLTEKALIEKAPVGETTEAGLTSEKTPIADTPQTEKTQTEDTQADDAKADKAQADKTQPEKTLSYYNPHSWKQTAKQTIEKTEKSEIGE